MTSRPATAGHAFNRDLPSQLLRRIATLILAAVAGILSISTVEHGESSERGSVPNIVFILVDDLGWSDLRC